jgi:hypothetical protein
MYDTVSQAAQQAVANVDSTDPNIRQTYNAFEFNFNARLAHGITFFGGTATERTIANVCSAAVTNPNILLYCDQSKSGGHHLLAHANHEIRCMPWYFRAERLRRRESCHSRHEHGVAKRAAGCPQYGVDSAAQ